MTVRVRIPPSPTGEPHIGTARAALFNFLFARRSGGRFVLRIEDTDRNRLVPGAIESTVEMLRWLDMPPDEGPGLGGDYGPYVQSERLPLYRAELERLLAGGAAYRCWCSPERLARVNEEKAARHEPPGYDRHCRALSSAAVAEQEASGVPPVVRLAVPLERSTTVFDHVRGEITVENSTLQDAVLLKSDGFPTYHFAVVVDDHHMAITHVLRGDEWIASAPLHVLIYQALGWTPPAFVHLPLILGRDKKKLSKRHGDAGVKDFRDQGYLPQALFNFLGLLGWSLDDKTEIISREQFIEHFDLDRIGKSPAVFDLDKLSWMNAEYLRALDGAKFAALVREWLLRDLPADLADLVTDELVAQIAPLLQTRIQRLDQIAPMVRYLFEGPELPYEPQALLGKRFAGEPDTVVMLLDETVAELQDLEDWQAEEILELLRKLSDRLLGEKRFRDFSALIRVAITGAEVSPPLQDSMQILSKRMCLARLRVAIERLRG